MKPSMKLFMESDRIIIDTDVLFAIYYPEDALHKRALSVLKECSVPIYVNSYCVQELITLFTNRLGREKTLLLISRIRMGKFPFKRVEPGKDIEEATFKVYEGLTTKNASFIDCSNIALVRQGQASAVLSFDAIYKAAGVAYTK